MRVLLTSLVLALCFVGNAYGQDMLKDRTLLLHDGTQGTQIIYLGRSNKTYLWHPSSAQVIPGWWTTRATGEYPDTICLRYGSEKYSPVTGKTDWNTQCTHVQRLLDKADQQVQGDVFGLAGRADVPFQLNPSKTTLPALAQRAGVAVTGPVIGEAGIVRPGEGPKGMNDLCETIRIHQQMFGEQDDTRLMAELCGL